MGLDVHAETIAVAVAEGEVRSLGIIPSTLESLRKLVKTLGRLDEVKACYEAGVTGVALYWQLLDYVTEVDHVRERNVRLERAVDEAVERAPAQMQAVVEGLQALPGARGASRLQASPSSASATAVQSASRWKRRAEMWPASTQRSVLLGQCACSAAVSAEAT